MGTTNNIFVSRLKDEMIELLRIKNFLTDVIGSLKDYAVHPDNFNLADEIGCFDREMPDFQFVSKEALQKVSAFFGGICTKRIDVNDALKTAEEYYSMVNEAIACLNVEATSTHSDCFGSNKHECSCGGNCNGNCSGECGCGDNIAAPDTKPTDSSNDDKDTIVVNLSVKVPKEALKELIREA